jgi:hypothetical protein
MIYPIYGMRNRWNVGPVGVGPVGVGPVGVGLGGVGPVGVDRPRGQVSLPLG